MSLNAIICVMLSSHKLIQGFGFRDVRLDRGQRGSKFEFNSC